MIQVRASSTPRAFNCPGSVLLEQLVPAVPDTDDSKEGTAAHEVAQLVLNGTVTLAEELTDRSMSNGVIVDGTMAEYVQQYTDRIKGRGVPYWVEVPVEWSSGGVIIPGTCDAAAFDEPNRTLYVDDLKYGFRIVEAEGNWQTTNYAIAIAQRIGLDNIDTIHLSIHQPRPYHADGDVRTETISVAELRQRHHAAHEICATIAAPNPPTKTGTHCTYCPALHVCPAAQQAGMNAVDVSGQATPQDMPNEALASELRTLERAKDMLNNRLSTLHEMAMDRIKNGQAVPGWGMEQSFGKSKWACDLDMLRSLTNIDCADQKMVTPAEAKRRGVPDEIVDAVTTRPFLGWKLKPVNLDKKAKGLFNNG